MSSQPTDIEDRLKEIGQIIGTPEFDPESVVDDLIQVRQDLEEHVSDQQRERYRRQCQDLAKIINQRLQQRCEEKLTEYEGRRPLPALDVLEGHLRDVRWLLDKMKALDPLSEQVQKLDDRYKLLATEMERARRLRELRDAVEDLWERAQKLEEASKGSRIGEGDRGSVETAIDYCKQAWEKVAAALQETMDWSENERDELLELKERARRHYDDIRTRHAEPTTVAIGGDFVPVILDLVKRAKQNPGELVTFFSSAEQDASRETMEVYKAAEIAKEWVVIKLWQPKIEEYIRDANNNLNQHKPREALSALRRWETLPLLNDPRVSWSLPDELQTKIRNAEKPIEVELDSLKKAEDLAQRAIQETDLVKAYQWWEKAQQAFSHLPSLPEIRETIDKKTKDEIKKLLTETQECLQQEQWGFAERRLNRANQLLNLNLPLVSELRDRYDELNQVYQAVRPLTTKEGRRSLSLQQEIEILESLRETFGESYWVSWETWQRRLVELQARSDVETLKQQIQAHCNANATLVTLESLHHDCLQMIEEPPEGISRDDRERLEEYLKQLEAWIGFVQVRDALASIRSIGEGGGGGWNIIYDLREIENKIEVAKRDPRAAQAVSALERELRELQNRDRQIWQELEGTKSLLEMPNLNNAREAVKRLERWMNKPSCYRGDLLELLRQARSILCQKLVEKAHTLIDQARPSDFENLDIPEIEKILKEYRGLNGDAVCQGAGGSLEETTRTPLAIARAHRLEKEARQRPSVWSKAKEAWEVAAKETDDDDWQNYCQQRARQAFKEAEFFRAKQATTAGEAERILRALCEDEILRNDWRVWFQHGNYCLQNLQNILRASVEGRSEADPDPFISASRDSLGRARRLVDPGDSLDNDLQNVLGELDLWEKLAYAQRKIRAIFQADSLTTAACEEAVAEYNRTSKSFAEHSIVSKLLDRFWQEQITQARQKLERQAEQTADPLRKVDAWLGIKTLFPGEEMAQVQLMRLGGDAWGDFQRKVTDTISDPTAWKFLRRRGARGGNVVPGEREIVELQIKETYELQQEAQNLAAILRMMNSRSGEGGISIDRLEGEKQRLVQWQGQLQTLRDALDQATRFAEAGLLEPEQFKKARYVLGQERSLEGTSGLVIVPETFRHQEHPSYRACKKYVDEMQRRRTKEEERRKRLDVCLRCAQVTTEAELDRFGELEKPIINDLRQKLKSGRFPIEEALAIMQEMRQEEPEDACGLQERVRYHDPEVSSGEYLYSLDVVYARIQAKVKQINTIRKWLAQFNLEAEIPGGDCPGIVHWPTKAEQIRVRQEQGPQGLTEALRTCQGVLNGEGEQGLYNGFWSLNRAYNELARERMMDYLRQTAGEGSIRLFEPAQSLDRQREELRNRIGTWKQEGDHQAQIIHWKIQNYEVRWNRFQEAFHALMGKTKIHIRPLSRTKRWQEFKEAAQEFYQICSKDPDFLEMLEQVRRETGLVPALQGEADGALP